MGVDISPIVEREEKRLEDFSGKRIAIDAYNALYQFLASIRQPDGTPLKDLKGNVTSHLSGLFYRTINFVEHSIRPVYVFDGKPPSFKKKEIEERKKRKEEYAFLEEKAKSLEEIKEIKTYAQATIHLSKEQVKEAKELLKAMGIPYVDAPSEGEAEAAYLAKKGRVFASSSQDYDSLLFGSPKLIRNLSITGRRKLPRKNEYVIVHPELVELERLLKQLGITRGQLICIGILVGTDFNKGVKRIGAKTALKLVKQYKSFSSLIKFVEKNYNHKFEDYIEEVYNFFLSPPVKDEEIKEMPLDEEKVKQILVDKHDFSEVRVENALRKYKEALERRKQTALSQWFK